MNELIEIKKKNKLAIMITIIAIIIIIFSLINICIWAWENSKSKKVKNKIDNMAIIIEKSGNDEEKIQEEKEILPTDPYWDFIKMNYVEVDFQKLLKENQETVSWITVNGTNINYPVVQHSDNEYYLNHSFDGSENSAGWIFLDYRNNIENTEKNTIIYGHSRENGTMFGSLKNIINNDWYNNSQNYVIKMSTIKENTLWQVFSIYKTPYTNDYIQTEFSNNNEFSKFINSIKNRSIYDFKTNIGINDNILTLSTCYGLNDRVVMHAKLIKKQER